MGFLSYLQKLNKKSNILRFLVVGLDNSGKTTILHQLCKIDTPVSPTFGYSQYFYNNICYLDIGGQMIFRDFWFNYYEKIDGVIYVIDMADRREVWKGIKELRVPVLVYANKMDQGDLNIECEGVMVQKVCAIENQGLQDGLDWLIEQCRNIKFD